jgi:uncharacterized alpha-E superfamily protein
MPRDEGYRFMLLGLLLERAEMTCRILSVRYARLAGGEGGSGFHAWVSVLKSVSAYEAYLKANDASLDPTDVLGFLLLDQEFPRSVFYCLQHVESLIDRLAADSHQTGMERAIGRARAQVEFTDISTILDSQLDRYLEDLQTQIFDVSEEVEAHFFRAGTDLQLHSQTWV